MINQAQDDFFNELYASTNQKVLAYIIVKCGKTEDVADIFQETYTEVVKIIQKHGISYFKQPDALVMQIAKRKIFRHYKLKEKLRGIEKMNYYNILSSDENDIAVQQTSFDDIAISKETVKRLARFFHTRFGKQNYVFRQNISHFSLKPQKFYLYYYMDKNISEIALLFSVKESTIKNRLYRTLRELRQNLDKED